MTMVRIIDIKQSVFADNDADAARLRQQLKERGVFLVNLMSSPGAGKTSVLKRTVDALKDEFRIGVMEADIDSAVDAETLSQRGVDVIQLHTGGMCHLDADMTRQGLTELGVFGGDKSPYDLVFLENVGNLVCPAEFDTGACRNVMILSVPEGDDKPLKYPLMFQVSQAVLVNKMDALSLFDFDPERARARAAQRNPEAAFFTLSARTGEGFAPWLDWLRSQIKADRG
ncbi:MAG: hydrogenase nickel incorporation protein HypB [Firmicutes bacterium]|nr:hydrogenase nickel incorporation protein HypB [Bacillota bacterium]